MDPSADNIIMYMLKTHYDENRVVDWVIGFRSAAVPAAYIFAMLRCTGTLCAKWGIDMSNKFVTVYVS